MLPPFITRITGRGKRGRPERRGAKRLTPAGLTPCQIRCPGASGSELAWTQNLSLTGIGLVAEREIPPGTVVRVLLVNAAHTFALTGEVRVLRCTRVITGDYLLGCKFAQALRHDDMVPFIV